MSDPNILFASMKNALSKAEASDPAALEELALDLAEVVAWDDPKNWPTPATRPSTERSARLMVRLRRRFNDDGDPQEADTMPVFLNKIADDGYRQPTEVGMWMYFLDLTNDLSGSNFSPAAVFRRWMNAHLKRALRDEPGGAP